MKPVHYFQSLTFLSHLVALRFPCPILNDDLLRRLLISQFSALPCRVLDCGPHDACLVKGADAFCVKRKELHQMFVELESAVARKHDLIDKYRIGWNRMIPRWHWWGRHSPQWSQRWGKPTRTWRRCRRSLRKNVTKTRQRLVETQTQHADVSMQGSGSSSSGSRES